MIHSKERVEEFSDAVFAFAITLLVVSFEVPDNFSALRDLMRGFISFGLSFLVLALIWKIHYNYFRRIEQIDNVIILFNMLLLFVVMFYVYPMKFMTNGLIGKINLDSLNELGVLFSIYSLGFVLVFLCITILYGYGARITEEPAKSRVLRYWSEHFFIYVLIGILSILLAQFKIGLAIGIPGIIYCLLALLCYWHGIRFKHA